MKEEMQWVNAVWCSSIELPSDGIKQLAEESFRYSWGLHVASGRFLAQAVSQNYVDYLTNWTTILKQDQFCCATNSQVSPYLSRTYIWPAHQDQKQRKRFHWHDGEWTNYESCGVWLSSSTSISIYSKHTVSSNVIRWLPIYEISVVHHSAFQKSFPRIDTGLTNLLHLLYATNSQVGIVMWYSGSNKK